MLAVIKKLFIILGLLAIANSSWAIWVVLDSKTDKDLNAIYLTTPTLGFAVGKSGTLDVTVDGVTWETRSVDGTTVDLYDVMFPETLEGYVVGNTNEVFVSSDGGNTFTRTTFAGIPSNAVFRKCSAYLKDRALAAYISPSEGSKVLVSTEAASWSTQDYLTIEVYGVFIGPGTTANNLWVWGKLTAGGDTPYIILKNGSAVYTTSHKINDLFFVDNMYGYAAQDGGYLLKTDSGGTSWTQYASDTTGVSDNLNAVYFITPNFGWAVGDTSTITFTANGGTSWGSYGISTALHIKDMFVKSETQGSFAFVRAFIAGTGGKILKLYSPIIDQVTPEAKPLGWFGEIKITGEGFLPGANVLITPEGVSLVTVSYESTNIVKATVWVGENTTTGTRDVIVTNPDATAVKKAGGFTIITSQPSVEFSEPWIDNNLYYPPSLEAPYVPRRSVSDRGQISYEVTSANGLSMATLKPMIMVTYEGGAVYYDVAPSAVRIMPSGNIALIDFTLPTSLPVGKVVHMKLYAEDNAGNVGIKDLLLMVTKPDVTTITGPTTILPTQNVFDLTRDPYMTCVLYLDPGEGVTQFTLFMYMGFSKVYQATYGPDTAATGVKAYSKRQVRTAAGEIKDEYRIRIQSSDIPLESGLIGMGICSIRAVAEGQTTPFATGHVTIYTFDP
jgi:hypothetical protein